MAYLDKWSCDECRTIHWSKSNPGQCNRCAYPKLTLVERNWPTDLPSALHALKSSGSADSFWQQFDLERKTW